MPLILKLSSTSQPSPTSITPPEGSLQSDEVSRKRRVVQAEGSKEERGIFAAVIERFTLNRNCRDCSRNAKRLSSKDLSSANLFPEDKQRFADEFASDLRKLDALNGYFAGDGSTELFFTREQMEDAMNQIEISEALFDGVTEADHFSTPNLDSIEFLFEAESSEMDPKEIQEVITKLLGPES